MKTIDDQFLWHQCQCHKFFAWYSSSFIAWIILLKSQLLYLAIQALSKMEETTMVFRWGKLKNQIRIVRVICLSHFRFNDRNKTCFKIGHHDGRRKGFTTLYCYFFEFRKNLSVRNGLLVYQQRKYARQTWKESFFSERSARELTYVKHDCMQDIHLHEMRRSFTESTVHIDHFWLK